MLLFAKGDKDTDLTPVVPDPGSRCSGHIVSDRLHQNSVNEELGNSRQPIESVLMPSGVGISGRSYIVCRVRRSIRVLLVGEPSLGDIRGQECKVNFLSVVGVKDEGIGGACNVGNFGYSADGCVKNVVVVGCELSG